MKQSDTDQQKQADGLRNTLWKLQSESALLFERLFHSFVGAVGANTLRETF